MCMFKWRKNGSDEKEISRQEIELREYALNDDECCVYTQGGVRACGCVCVCVCVYGKGRKKNAKIEKNGKKKRNREEQKKKKTE